MKLKDIIKSARIAKNMTQEVLSEKLGISTPHLQHIESGIRNPSVPLLISIAQILDISLDSWLNLQKTGNTELEKAGALINQLNPRDLNVIIAAMEAMITEN